MSIGEKVNKEKKRKKVYVKLFVAFIGFWWDLKIILEEMGELVKKTKGKEEKRKE